MSVSSGAPWRVVWITGASTGIGREVALKLARRGVKVAASARSVEALTSLAAENANIHAVPLDVTNLSAVRQAAHDIEAMLGAIDLAIFNAGAWDPMMAQKFDAERIERAMAVNYQGVVNGLDAVLPAMIGRKAGHVAMVSSVAGYRGMPNGLAYNPTKAALISLAEALDPDLEQHGVWTSVINPGFVETPMTSVNKFPMPFLITSDDAANRIIRGLEKKKFEIVFPKRMMLTMKFLRYLPTASYLWVSKMFIMPKKRPGA
jgi:short-subunit dehydrogenase